MNPLILIPLVLAARYHGPEISQTDQWTEDFSFTATGSPHVVVKNVWGPITVRTHDQPFVRVTAREKRVARDQEMLDRSRDLLFLTVDHQPDLLRIELDGINNERHHRDPCPGCRLEYAFELTVPANASIEATTVMDGAVDIAGVGNVVRARNVNGDVYVAGLTSCNDLGTVNGELDAHFAAPPMLEKCAIHTVNGDMTIVLPSGSDAEFDFDLFNGEVESDFELTALPAKPEVTRVSDGRITRYRLRTPSAVRLGAGGPRFTFESINGDVNIVAKR
ncbi:MAG: hypothetical protein R3200_04955 [Xanthomonadales bacterium]|nr:hypothetical protein [Xanthomonadales bacterium]